MEIEKPKDRPELKTNSKLTKRYNLFQKLIIELRKHNIADQQVEEINKYIETINTHKGDVKEFSKALRKVQSRLLKYLEKESKLVVKNHYRTIWLAIGMSGIGIPLGVAFGTSLGNMAFIGIGLPMGMVIGIAVGVGMDKKAEAEGRQLDIELGK